MKECLNCKTHFHQADWVCPKCGFAPTLDNGYPVFAPELAQVNDTYESDFFTTLAQLEKGHFWFEGRNQLLLWAVKKHFPHIKNLFEIGCGTGFVLQQFAHHLHGVTLFGSDLLVDGLRFANERVPSATLFQTDARNIPYYQEFDLIGAFDVIEHIEEDELALAQMFKALKPGGGLIISVPQHQFLWSVVDDMSYHKRRYHKQDLVQKVEKAGFKVIKTTSFVSLLLPLMLLTRSRKANQTDLDLFAEFKLNPILNRLLSVVMRIEMSLIRLGITFRAGGSRVLIARRPE
ncbi:MAG: class I SAM-dependent methyltransferase [Anaerolineae bacterium]|jgi:SAM-dependent methyltransferase|nr:class I SAM-dependent methyltransferase [Anaerolineae bacterium]